MRLALVLLFLPLACAWLSSKDKEIVSSPDGHPVRLRCVNWYGAHQELFVSGGLELRSCGFIADRIQSIGANCVRIPLSVQLVRDNPAPLESSVAGVNDPGCNVSTAMGVLDCQIRELTSRGLMVILNSHNSQAGWVGVYEMVPQGLWHLPGYPTSDWLASLTALASRYRSNPLVVGIDIRNEIHDQDGTVITWGQSDDIETDWKVATLAADAAIREVNPDLLVIVSGLCMGYDIRALQDLQNYRSKFVFTVHIYPWSYWFTYIDWNSIMIVASILTGVSALGIFTLGGMGIFTLWGMVYHKLHMPDPLSWGYIIFPSIIVPALALGFSIIWVQKTRSFGCNSLAEDVIPVLWGSVTWLALAICSGCVLISYENIFRWKTAGFWACVWCLLVSTSLVGLSAWFQTYAAAEWDMAKLSSDHIPVWVGEFGANITETKAHWQWVTRFLADKHWAYWAVNGRRWFNQWEREYLGLLTEDYGAVRDEAWTRTLFPNCCSWTNSTPP